MDQIEPRMLAALLLGLLALVVNAVVWWAVRYPSGPRAVPGVMRRVPLAPDPAIRSPQTRPAAVPRHALTEARLRTPAMLRALLTAATAGFAALLLQLHGAGMLRLAPGTVPWPELVLLLALGWHTLAMWLWELRFDPVGLSAPLLILGRRARLWRELVSVTDDGPLFVRLHFADGAVIAVPKQVVGCDALLHMADHWLSQDQGPPHARTARG